MGHGLDGLRACQGALRHIGVCHLAARAPQLRHKAEPGVAGQVPHQAVAVLIDGSVAVLVHGQGLGALHQLLPVRRRLLGIQPRLAEHILVVYQTHGLHTPGQAVNLSVHSSQLQRHRIEIIFQINGLRLLQVRAVGREQTHLGKAVGPGIALPHHIRPHRRLAGHHLLGG